MAGALMDEYADALLNAGFRNTGSLPSACYLMLFVTEPTVGDTLSTISSGNKECADANYTRRQITFGAPSAVNGVRTVASSSVITFASPNGFATGGTEIVAAGICSAASGTSGVMMVKYTLTTHKWTNQGETLTVNTGDLTFGMQ